MTYELHRADARHLPLGDGTVDLIVTSPPYFALRSYQDDGEHYDGQIGSEATPAEFLRALWAVLDECWRVLKPSGSCFVNLGDKFANAGLSGPQGASGVRTNVKQAQTYGFGIRPTTNDVRPKSRMLLPHRFALGAIDPDYRTHVEGGWTGPWPQWVCRMDIVWAKPNGLPESVTDRVRASHEYWFHLTRSERYFAAVDEVREEYTPAYLDWHKAKPAEGWPRAKTNTDRGDGGAPNPDLNPLGKLPGSVWSIPSEPLRVPDHLPQHFAAFPSEWPRRLIAGWSPTGICTVCGEGRRPVVAKDYRLTQVTNNPYKWDGEDEAHTLGGQGVGRVIGSAGGRAETTATITGYSCACPQPDAPTRPAVVLDPFVGTGTTVAVAHHLGRHGIGIDLSADYLRLARWRCEQDWSLYTKATGGDPDTRDPDQLALFEVTG